MPTATKRLLFEILSILIREWGVSDVQRALQQITAERITTGKDSANIGRRSLGRQRGGTPAANQIAKLSGSIENKDLIVRLAEQFDKKEFLPTLRDVYLFLSKRGAEGMHLKNRSEGFRKVLDVLISTPRDSLEKMLREGVYLGPSRLGPLSDAIRATGESMRSNDLKSAESKNNKD